MACAPREEGEGAVLGVRLELESCMGTGEKVEGMTNGAAGQPQRKRETGPAGTV